MPLEPAGEVSQIRNDFAFRLVKLVRVAPIGQQQLHAARQLAQPGRRQDLVPVHPFCFAFNLRSRSTAHARSSGVGSPASLRCENYRDHLGPRLTPSCKR
jgi:hypothetical protein